MFLLVFESLAWHSSHRSGSLFILMDLIFRMAMLSPSSKARISSTPSFLVYLLTENLMLMSLVCFKSLKLSVKKDLDFMKAFLISPNFVSQ